MKNTYITPVPEEVGLLTRSTLLDNITKACETRENKYE